MNTVLVKSLTTEKGCYLCRFYIKCKHFNPAATLPVTIIGINREQKQIQKLNPCTHGGGCGCFGWRKFTSRELGWK